MSMNTSTGQLGSTFKETEQAHKIKAQSVVGQTVKIQTVNKSILCLYIICGYILGSSEHSSYRPASSKSAQTQPKSYLRI